MGNKNYLTGIEKYTCIGKLTLYIEEEVIDQANAYANAEGKSLSGIVEEFLKSLIKPAKSLMNTPKVEIIQELRGSLKLY